MPMIEKGTSAIRHDIGLVLSEYNPAANGFIAAEVLPDLPMLRRAGTYPVIEREEYLKIEDTAPIANGGAYPRLTTSVTEDSYSCKKHGYEHTITDEDREEYRDQFELETVVSQKLYQKLLLKRERAVAAAVFNTSTWTGAALYTDVASAPWATVGSAIIAPIVAAAEKVRLGCGMEANTLIVSKTTFNNMLLNTGIRSALSGAAIITMDMLTSVLGRICGIDRVLVGGQVYDSASDGQAFTGANVWSNTYAMVAALSPKGPAVDISGLGRTFMWEKFPDMTTFVEQYREDQTESDVIKVRHFRDEKITDKYAAHLLKIA